MCRLFVVAILSCIAILGFAKKQIVLENQTRFPIFQIEAFIDEGSKELILDFGKDQRSVRVIITDLSGNTICNEEIVMRGISVLPLPAINKGEYVLSLSFENVELYGFFDII